MSEQDKDEEVDEVFWSFKNPIAWGLGITILFMGFVAVLAFGNYCNHDSCRSRLSVFLSSKPNEIGDTLAGVSSTVAFVWIVVTVWIQSQELREQRRELKAQRKEFEQVNRSMNQQTAIFQGEERKRRTNTVFSKVNLQIRTVLDILNEEVGKLRWEGLEASTGTSLVLDLVPRAIEVNRTKDDYPVNDASLVVFLKMIDQLELIAKRADLASFQIRPTSSSSLISILEIFKKILASKSDMSEATSDRVTIMKLEDRCLVLEDLINNPILWA